MTGVANGQPDDVDRAILGALALDGRATSTDLARSIGISDAAASARVRRLINDSVARVTAVFDVEAAGYLWQAICYVQVGGVPPADVAARLAAHPRAWAVSAAVGRHDLVAPFMFVDKAEMTRVLTEELPAIPGIVRMECDLDVESLLFRPPVYNVMLHQHGPPEVIGPHDAIEFPAPVVKLDELDHRIINLLRVDGRRSNRDIGRDLDVSEGAVRQRIRRLQDAGLMRIAAWIEPSAIGESGAVSYLRITSSAPARTLVAALARIPEITVATAVLGPVNLVAMCVTRDPLDMHRLIGEVRATSGVSTVEHLEIAYVHHIANHFIRIPAPAA